jgi:hypothetical protein
MKLVKADCQSAAGYQPAPQKKSGAGTWARHDSLQLQIAKTGHECPVLRVDLPITKELVVFGGTKMSRWSGLRKKNPGHKPGMAVLPNPG